MYLVIIERRGATRQVVCIGRAATAVCHFDYPPALRTKQAMGRLAEPGWPNARSSSNIYRTQSLSFPSFDSRGAIHGCEGSFERFLTALRSFHPNAIGRQRQVSPYPHFTAPYSLVGGTWLRLVAVQTPRDCSDLVLIEASC